MEKMIIKSYLGILIFFAVYHKVSSLSADADHREHTQNIRIDRKYMMKELQNIQRRLEIRQGPIDNYDLIVAAEPSKTLIKDALRHRHRHHRLRSGRDAKLPIKNDNTHKPLKDENTLRKNFKLTGETNMTQIQRYTNATTKNYLNEHQRVGENVATTLKQKDKDATTKTYLYKNRSGRENETTTQTQEDKDVTTKDYRNEHQRGGEEVATTFKQKYKDTTTTKYRNENRIGRENEATTQTKKKKDATTKTYLYKNQIGRENETTTQTQEDKDATTTNYRNESRSARENEATTQIKEYKGTTAKNYLYENRSEGGNEATTQIQRDKVATTTKNLIKNWSESQKIATTSQKPVKERQKVTPRVPFYRRVNYLSDQERNKPQKWVHCLDLLAPRLKGYKDNWRKKEKNSRNSEIQRLVELITTDVSQYTEAEIIAVLSQISNFNIRLYQWDYTAISTIIKVIVRGNFHTFKTLKAGLKYMFSRWHLDTSMLRTFLEQTRIIRPPCIDISGSGGYTKKAGGIVLFTKPDKSTRKPRGPDESCHSRETTVKNND